MIAKLPLLLGAEHQFFVDGTAMVRDVWVDGTENGLPRRDARGPERQQGGQEFHTVAVVGERRGGTRFFALDVTNATTSTQAGAPKFLWIYPQPERARDARVRRDLRRLPARRPAHRAGPARGRRRRRRRRPTPTMAGAGGRRTRRVPRALGHLPERRLRSPVRPRPRRPHGRRLDRGGAVRLLLPRTRAALPPTTPASRSASRSRRPSGMVPWGQNARASSDETNDYFFDTATFGDAGGQLWVLRFNVPGKLGDRRQGDNWYGGARLPDGRRGRLQALRRAAVLLHHRQRGAPGRTMTYRVFAGTGDRFNLLDKHGGTCGPDNIRACVLRGCTVTLDRRPNSSRRRRGSAGCAASPQAACGDLAGTVSDGDRSPTCEVRGARERRHHELPARTLSTATHQGHRGDAALMRTRRLLRCSLDGAPSPESSSRSPTTTQPDQPRQLVLLAPRLRGIGDRAISSRRRPGEDLRRGAALGHPDRRAPTRRPRRGTRPHVGVERRRRPTARERDLEGLGHLLRPRAVHHRRRPHLHHRLAGRADLLRRRGLRRAIITWNTTQPTIGDGDRGHRATGCKISKCTAESRARRLPLRRRPDDRRARLRIQRGTSDPRSDRLVTLVPPQADQTTVFVNQKGQMRSGSPPSTPRGAHNVGMADAIDPSPTSASSR